MASRTDIARKFIEAQRSRDASAIDAVAATLAGDVIFVTRRDTIEGRDAVVQRLRNPVQGGGAAGGLVRMGFRLRRLLARRSRARSGQAGAGGLMGQIQFGPPVEEGSVVKMTAPLPPNPVASSVTMTFTFDDRDKVKRIEQVLA